MMKTTKRRKWERALAWLVYLLVPIVGHAADAVNVTMEADATSLTVGQTTTVRVYGQIDGAIEAGSLQISTWYIDVLNSNGAAASGYASVATASSDNTLAVVPYDGTVAGDHLRGIHDWFLLTASAGLGSRIELASFEVTALAPGTSTFSAAPGTTLAGLAHDFQVAKIGFPADPFTGGNYSAASVAIMVTAGGVPDLSGLDLEVEVVGSQAMVTFNPVPGYDHVVQWSATLLPLSWTPISVGPHNTGSENTVVAGFPERFYRVVLTPQ